ncbi:MAG TPA: PQQ-binding-like beta-propeller repeat protein [Spongiibacteraceae bacterium]|jgi:polyvinyl alcohol dehydrogenase (cytochrome)|nr:PQQ-binding-like beta-propeller repeat protein [Spongiibacteraceae bacterium]HUH38760.1 PQQ-binding-like beta-propeller repeat protein [Spongiibacteraceae bacterium]
MSGLKNRLAYRRAVMLLAGLCAGALAAVSVSAQDEPLMDGMGNINHDVLNADSPAAQLYRSHCAQCHENPVGRIPPRSALRYRPAEIVHQALTAGTMSPMVKDLSDAEVISLVKFITGREPKAIADPATNLCARTAAPVAVTPGDWTSIHGDIEGHRFRDVAAINAGSVDRLQLKWAYAYPGGAAGPATLADGAVFLAGTGYVVALSADSGCVNWVYPTEGRIVRSLTVADFTAYHPGKSTGGDGDTQSDTPAVLSVVLFGDDAGDVTALDASSGAPVWKTTIEVHPLSRITASPTVYDGVVYVPLSSIEDPLTHDVNYVCCDSRGGVVALSLQTGKQLWKQQHIAARLGPVPPTDTEPQFKQGPAGASTYTPLTIDAKRGLVYASTAEEYGFTNLPGPYSVMAYDLKTGKRAWQQAFLPPAEERRAICESRETDCRNFFSMGTSVLIQPLSETRDILVVGQKAGLVYGLDPDDGGRVLWTTRVAEGGDLGGVMYGLGADSRRVYVPVSDVDAVVGDRTGSLAALDPASGRILWQTEAPEPDCNWTKEHCIGGQVAAVTVVSDMVFTGSWDGHLRIYAAQDGRLLRDIDTALDFPAVNGVASGGQVSGYPVTVGNNALFITSGASSVVKPGNALLVYTLDGK